MFTFINHYSLLILGFLFVFICCYFIFRNKSIYFFLLLVVVVIFMTVSYFTLDQKSENLIINNLKNDKDYLLEKPQFVEFFSPTCLACVISKPVVDGLQKDFIERIDFLFVNVGDNESSETVVQFGISVVPTFMILDRNGQVVFRASGVARSKIYRPELEKVLDNSIN